MKIISFITTARSEVVRRILEQLGVDTVIPIRGVVYLVMGRDQSIEGTIHRKQVDKVSRGRGISLDPHESSVFNGQIALIPPHDACRK